MCSWASSQGGPPAPPSHLLSSVKVCPLSFKGNLYPKQQLANSVPRYTPPPPNTHTQIMNAGVCFLGIWLVVHTWRQCHRVLPSFPAGQLELPVQEPWLSQPAVKACPLREGKGTGGPVGACWHSAPR